MNIKEIYNQALHRQAIRQGRELSPVNLAVADVVFKAATNAMQDTRQEVSTKTFKIVSAPTGSSKTNSSLTFAITMFKTDPAFSCAFVVEEIVHANEIYKALCEEITKQHVGIWSSFHDEKRHRPSDIERYGFDPELTNMREMINKSIVVFTHRKWLSEMEHDKDFGVRQVNGRPRDVLFIDEQPSTIQIIEKTPADILKVRDQIMAVDQEHSWNSTLTEVAKRMDLVFQSNGDEMEAVQLIEFLESFDFTEANALSFWSNHHGMTDSSSFMEGLKFLNACSYGYCFMTRRTPRSFVAYLPSFKPEPNQVILDATADLSGIYPLLGGICHKGMPKIDYSNLSIHHIEPPEEYKRVNAVVKNRSRAEGYATFIRKTVMDNTKIGDRVLVVMHKSMVEAQGLFKHSPSGYDEQVFSGRLTNIIWWGQGIGSNKYKDCTEVFMFSEFFQPRRTTVAKTLGAKQQRAEEAGLKRLNQKLPNDYLSVEEGELLRWTKQLACRGNVRNISSKGVCGQMRLHTSMNFNRLTSNLDRLFPNAKPPVRTLAINDNKLPKRRQSLIDLLSCTNKIQVSFKDIEMLTGIKSCNVSRELGATVVKPIVGAYGWSIVSAKELGHSGKGQWLKKKDTLLQ